MYLAVNEDRLVTIKEIADAHDISKNHLMKLAFELGKQGYIETVRGRSGGLRLKLSPPEITLGAVVRHTEEDFNAVECFESATNRCKIAGVCRLKGILHQAMTAFLNVLDGYTLADLIQDRSALQKLLQMV